MKKQIFSFILLIAIFAACVSSPSSASPADTVFPKSTRRRTPTVVVTATPTSVNCVPTDQDNYIYHPDRLQVLLPCIRVTGMIASIKKEADGDLHIRLILDPLYANLLTAANVSNQHGDLVVEPICVNKPTQKDAVSTCKIDPDPFQPHLIVKMHVWMEGRYVLDNDHGRWAELHPLYHWGDFATLTETPPPIVIPTP